MHSIPEPPVCPVPSTYIVGERPADAYRYFGVCPHAQTLTAYSITHSAEVLFVLSCRRWSCRLCAETKIRKLAYSVRQANPNRLLTLTVDPARHASPAEAWQSTRKQVPILIRKLRAQFGEIEYLRVTEVTKKGWPHYHLLIRSGFLPHSVVKRRWEELTGAKIVDLRQVKKSFQAYQYLVKYLSKLHRLEWTERHVSLSRNFVPPQEGKNPNPIQSAEHSLFHEHPANWVAHNCVGSRLTRLSPQCHLITPRGQVDAEQ